MYSFQPLADIPVSHAGFAIIVFVVIFFMLAYYLAQHYGLWNFKPMILAAAIIAPSYVINYHVLDQTPKKSANQQVIGKFIGFHSEGYDERSGKSRVSRHYVYVIYEVDGLPVLLRASEGMTYPPEAILYKN